MAYYSDTISDDYGRPIPSVSVLVLEKDGSVANLTEDGGAALANPVLSDTYGRFSFNATDAVYALEFRYASRTLRQDDVIVGDPPSYIGLPGPADAFRASLAIFKTAAITDGKSDFDGSTWYWTSGNYSATPADQIDLNIVKANSTALSVGAWVRQKAAGVVTQQAGTGSVPQALDVAVNALGKTPEQFGAVGDGVADDTAAVQAAVNRLGLVRLLKQYKITAPITLRGGTQLVGDPGAKLVWAGPITGNILQDSSVTTPTDINQNIRLENFEIDGGDLVSGDVGQVAINFFRVGNVTIRGLIVHGVGGSGIRWGLSMADTVGVLVESNQIYDCRQGDAIQGVGRSVVVRNNRIGRLGSATSNFGDTGIALLYDFNATTNPGGAYSSDWDFDGNTIIGNYNLAGAYVGVGQVIQTGIAVGPFQIGANVNGRIRNNVVFGCYLNCWLIAMDNVAVEGNDFGSHAATATGNTRFDGITNLRMRGNTITLRLAGTGPDYCGILLNAQRSTFGASVFDADVSKFDVSGNTISSVASGVTAIRGVFGQVNTSPSYTSRLTNGVIENNKAVSIATAVALAPTSGAPADVCNDVVVRGNKADATATALLIAGGGAAQYVNVRVLDNPSPYLVTPVSGTGVGGLKTKHIASGKVAAAGSGTTVDLVILPAGNYKVFVSARVPNQNSGTLSASATVHVNGTSARITADNGAAMTITNPSGLLLRATQSAGTTADISFDLEYTL